MPAQAPASQIATATALGRIGERIRAQRKALGVSATAAAEAADLSRVTLHRIERGEASVTMGAYLNVTLALGLDLGIAPVVAEAHGEGLAPAAGAAPANIRVADHPQLARLAWQLPVDTMLTPEEALGLYERNWRHVDVQAMGARERALLDALVRSVGQGHLLV